MDTNQIINIGLVLLTGLYVFFTYKLLRSTEKSYQEMTRPYISVYFNVVDYDIILYINNIGKHPAKDVLIKFDDTFLDLPFKINGESSLSNILTYQIIPPDFAYTFIVNWTPTVLQTLKNENLIFNVEIRYSDFQSNIFSDIYKINLNDIVLNNKVVNRSSNYFLEEISKSLKKIEETLTRNK